MKVIRFFSLVSFFVAFVSCTNKGNKTMQLKVSGNCEMCKERIETALKTDGLLTAEWNVDTKILSLNFDSTRINLEKIESLISASGHDTEHKKAENKTYQELPECCQYERVK